MSALVLSIRVPFAHLINTEGQPLRWILLNSTPDRRPVSLKNQTRATLAQLVERLIFNLPFLSYAIDSIISLRCVLSANSAYRPLFKPDRILYRAAEEQKRN